MNSSVDSSEKRYHEYMKRAQEAVLSGVSKSLYPLLFFHHLPDEDLSIQQFTSGMMSRNLSMVCKLAGLLLQAYWIRLRTSEGQNEIPREVDNALLQIWAGHQPYTVGSAISLLQDAAGAPKGSGFRNAVGAPQTFVRWRDLIKSRSNRLKLTPGDSAGEEYLAYEELIKAIPLLLAVNYKDECFVWLDGKKIDAFPLLYRHPDFRKHIFLYRFKNDETQPEIVFEDPFSDRIVDCRLSDHPAQDEKYRTLRGFLGFRNVVRGSFHMFGEGYEHIRELAGAIAAYPETPIEIFEELREFRDDRSVHGRQEEWLTKLENAMVLLLAKQGPTGVLSRILGQDLRVFGEYVKYLDRRGVVQEEAIRLMYKQEEERRLASIKGYMDVVPKLKETATRRIKTETRCWTILRAAGWTPESGGGYVESVGMRVEMLKAIWRDANDSNKSIIEVATNTGRLLERTFRFLYCFYDGLTAYGKAMAEAPSDYRQHEQAFDESTKAAAKKVRKESAGGAIMKFIELTKDDSRNDHIYSLLGRKSICEIEMLKEVTGGGWVKSLNRLKHEPPPDPPVERPEILRIVEQAIGVHEFLAGRSSSSDDRVRMGYQIEQIYPHVVSFRKAKRSCDGFVIHEYVIANIDGGEEGQPISILTPREFISGEQYYCIPNQDKMMPGLWLDPFLIPCSAVDPYVPDSIETTDTRI